MRNKNDQLKCAKFKACNLQYNKLSPKSKQKN